MTASCPRPTRRTRLAALLAASALCLPATAIAQDVEPEIIVTAERRGTGLDKTAAAVTAIGDVDSIDADHPSELLARAPGVFINRNSGQESLTSIRSPVLTGGAGAGSFLYLQDGVPLRSPGFANVNGLFEANIDLADRLEVVRGPSGAFYGANAIHGVINVISPDPSINRQLADVSVGTYHTKGEFGIGREARGRGFYAGLSLHNDIGFRDNSGVDQQGGVFRLTRDLGAWSTDTILTANNLNQETAGYAEGEDIYKQDNARKRNPNPEAFRDVKSVRLQSTLTRDTGDGGTLSITPYARWTDMDFKQHFLPSSSLEENGHWSLGVQSAYYAAPQGPWTISYGIDAEYTEGFLEEVQENPDIFSYRQGVHYDYDITAVSVSPFAQAERQLTERWSLLAAARIDYTGYDYTNNTDDGLFGRNLRPADRSDDFTTVSPKLALRYTTDTSLSWVSYTRGARPPQTSDLYALQSNETVGLADPETIDALELGWRGQMGERLTAELVAFYMYKENYYFRDADGFNVPDGETSHVGVEADVEFAITDALTLAANGTIAQHEYEFTRTVESQASEVIEEGNEVDTAPNTIGGARLTWAPSSLLGGGFSTEGEWVHVGEYYTDAANLHAYEGHDIFHLRAQKAFGFVTVRAAVKNIFDTRYAERADYAFGNYRYFPDEGRTLTVGLRLEN